MNYSDNVARFEQAVEEFIAQEKLDKNTQVLDPFLHGCEAIRGMLLDGMESHCPPLAIEEVTAMRRCVRATSQLELLAKKLSE